MPCRLGGCVAGPDAVTRSALHRAAKPQALDQGFAHWGLMALLFFGGVMNLYWIGGLALFVLLEKTVPPGHWLASLSGLGLVGWGVALLAVAA